MASGISSPDTPSLPRRRNGKPQSCEPCRKAKTACDHGIPKCSRCIRKEIGDQCSYHPAPMTGIKGSTKITKPRQMQDDAASTTSINTASNLLIHFSQQQSCTTVSESRPLYRKHSSQFLGPTSYSAVFSEHQASLGGNLWGTTQDEGFGNQTSRDSELDAEAGSQLLKYGMDVLAVFPSQTLSTHLLERYFAVYDEFSHEPSMRYCLKSIFNTYTSFQATSTDRSSLLRMSEDILRNSYAPMPTYKTGAEWLESFSGNNLRFEIVGTFLAIFGLAVVSLPENDPVFNSEEVKLGKRQYARKLGTAAENCQMLCSETAIVNEFTVWLMHHLQILQSLYSGDDSETSLTILHSYFVCLYSKAASFGGSPAT